MLPKEEIRFVFNVEALMPGDILLMNTYHERQRGKMPGCVYDHAAIYIGDAFIVEADGLGVEMNHIYSYAFKEENHACVLRVNGITPRKIKGAIDFARTNFGKEFSGLEARRVLDNKTSDKSDTSNKMFCSRLVAQAYGKVGINLVPNINYCAPDDFLQSSELTKVVPPTAPFTEEMAPTVMRCQHQKDNSEAILQEAFAKMSKVYGEDIQTLGQLISASFKKGELDDKAIEVLKTETKLYRDPQEETRRSWPWFDDDEQFFAHFTSIEEAMYFLNAQMLHYDKTYLPFYQRNAIEINILRKIFRTSKMLAHIAKSKSGVFDEAVRVRKRLEYLYAETFRRYEREWCEFVKKVGYYQYFEYHEPVYDMSELLQLLLQTGITPEMLKDD